MLEPPFVDRDRELRALENLVTSYRPLPIYLYGPEGCGKSRLLREFVTRSRGRSDVIALYVDFSGYDARRAVDLDSILRSSIVSHNRFISAFLDTIRSLNMSLNYENVLSVSLSFLADIAARAMTREEVRGKGLILVYDDLTRGVGDLRTLANILKSLYNYIQEAPPRYGLGFLNVVVTTSEGASIREVSRHTYVSRPMLVWNLSKDSFEDLFRRLNPPESVSFSDTWRLLGGNPRKLWELVKMYSWDLESMTRDHYDRVRRIVRRAVNMGLGDLLRRAAIDIAYLDEAKGSDVEALIDFLVEENMIIELGLTIYGDRVEQDLEIGVGRYYAWQIPMYRELVLKTLSSSL